MSTCPTYVADPSLQLVTGGVTGHVDCTAHAASDAVDHATCGAHDPGGRTIRLLSNEPVPDPTSPGLSIPQVAAVTWENWNVYLEQHVGYKALDWDEYEAKRRSGRGAIIQVGYGPIADSPYDAGRGFRGNHALFESVHSTEDPLADGRAPGVYDRRKNGPVVYPRDVMKRAAGLLDTGAGHAGFGKVWCAFTRDVAPEFAVYIDPKPGNTYRRYRAFTIKDGRISGFVHKRTRGIHRYCSIPRAFRWPGHDTDLHFLVRIHGGIHSGEWVALHWSHER